MPVPPAAVKAIFLEAVAVDDPVTRAALLSDRCGADVELLARVNALLAANDRALENAGTASFGAADGTAMPTAEFPKAEDAIHPGQTADLPGRDERVGAVLGGKYKLVEEIGEGGMGSVFMAQQTEPVKRAVAVKVIKAGMDSKAVLARFEAERQALAMMDHPNIARVLDAGTTDSGRPYFVMELVKGVPITQYCDERKLTPRRRLELFVPVCAAIQHAHQKGVIHRDVKPNNVLVALYDDKPVPKVIDFGIAKAAGSTLTDKTLMTGFGAVVGTPEYMSPEQANLNNLDVDTRSDVYSLGVLLYELLTGSTPVDKKSLGKAALLEVLRIVREVEAPRPSAKLSTIDTLPSVAACRGTEPAKLSGLMKGELDWVLLKALEKDRTRRYDTANGLARDIQRYLADEIVEARPPSTGYRLRKFVRRHKGQVIAATLVFFALLAGIAGTTFGLVRAEERRAEAEQARQREAAQRALAEENERKAVTAAGEERRAKEREAAQRAKAEGASDRTRQVLDAMVSGVTGDSLSTQKEITAEQKKFLAEVLTYYREFAGEAAGDETTRARTAGAAHCVGMIEYRLGRRAEGAAAYRTARDNYQKLAADFPAAPAYRRELANSQRNLGYLLADLGQRAKAEEQFRNALAIQEKLAADFPADPEYREALGYTHNSLGVVLAALGQGADAEVQLRKSLAVREKLAADFLAVPAYRGELAHTHTNLGNLLAERGQRGEAAEQFRKALALLGRLAADFPAVPEYRRDLARCHNNLGLLLVALRQRAAAEQYRQALEIRERLCADFPTVPDYRRELAASHTNQGNLLAALGQRAEAEAPYRKSLAIQGRLVADFPAVPDYRQGLAECHNSLGLLLPALGQREEAADQFVKSLAIREKLAADFPAVPAYRVELGGSYCNLGLLVRDGGEPADSLAWFQKALDTLGPVHEKEPQDVRAKEFLRNSHLSRATAYDQLKNYAEAVKDWDRAVELSPEPEQPFVRAGRATSRLQAGQVAEAVAEVAELTQLANWNADQWYNFACVYAVASGKIADKKTEYADRAMERLAKAVKAGYKDAAHVKKDTDLDALRAREEFKKLLAELEAKFPPKTETAPKPPEKK